VSSNTLKTKTFLKKSEFTMKSVQNLLFISFSHQSLAKSSGNNNTSSLKLTFGPLEKNHPSNQGSSPLLKNQISYQRRKAVIGDFTSASVISGNLRSSLNFLNSEVL
jgi:hypothetical protein